MNSRFLKGFVVGILVASMLSVSVTVFSQQVSRERHPNLAAAQQLIERALSRLSDAQNANEFDLAGHAARAKLLLDQAYGEIRLAAGASNQRR